MVRSLSQRIRNKFQVAVAEVGDNEVWQLATIGIACVANSHRHCEEILNEIVDYVRETRLDAELIDVETDIIAFDEE